MATTEEQAAPAAEETKTAPPTAPSPTPPADPEPDTPAPTTTIDDVIGQLTIPREKVERPTFIDGLAPGLDMGDNGDQPQPEEKAPTEPITDDDEANQDYLNYSDEHKDTATFLIMTIDRAIAFGCGIAAGSSADKWRKFEARASISEDYLDVTAALVKKYQARMSLEFIFLVTLAAIYAPQVSMAVSEGKRKAQVVPTQEAA